jgi:uncharacterized membrane protein YfbV (UPF0208 family)
MVEVLSQAVALALFVLSWLFLGLFALGDKFASPIQRTEPVGDYV